MFIKKYSSAISFIIIALTIYYSFSSLMPSKISDENTPSTGFSTQRALLQLKKITEQPHYVGSKNHKTVQNYIVEQLNKLGLETQIQEHIAINKKWHAATDVQNILARIKGTDSSKALLLLTHYDSAPHSASFGASDAGSGIVTILESVRAFLASDKKPKNDIIILISDAEEIGLLGASAFVNYHPWAKDVGLALNFEARGSGGPSYMLVETNGGNKKLIEDFNKAKPKYPVASSLMYSIYKMLPNDTDLTVFKEGGDIEGYNFAFIDDHYDYHTAQDTYDRLDKNTLEHQGTYLMPLLNYFANTDLTNLKSNTDYVYFNLPVFGLVFYPFSWVWPMVMILTFLFIMLLINAIWRKKIDSNFLIKGIVSFLVLLVFAGLIGFFGWKALIKIYPQYNDILQGFTYNGHTYIAAFVTLTIAICFLVYAKFFRKTSVLNLSIAPIIIWILINFAVAIYLKGAGYFIIALVYGIITFAVMLFSNRSTQTQQLILSILAIPILLVFVPMIEMFPVGLGLKILFVSTIFTVLLFGLLLPVFSLYKNSKALGRLFLLLAFLLFISASFKSNYNEERKKPNSIIYALDADKNEAYWASYDNNVDNFTKQFLGESPTKGSFDKDTASSKYKTGIKLYTKTEVKDIPPPLIEINYDTIINSNRNISLTITPQRPINRIDIMAENVIHFNQLDVNGVSLSKKDNNNYGFDTSKNKTIINYYFTKPNETLNLWFSMPQNENPQLTISEVSFDLFKSTLFNLQKRDKNMIPTPFVINDAIIIKKRINLN